jgi:hypothetical protein
MQGIVRLCHLLVPVIVIKITAFQILFKWRYGRIISMSYIENMDKRTKLRTLRNAMDELSRRTVHI